MGLKERIRFFPSLVPSETCFIDREKGTKSVHHPTQPHSTNEGLQSSHIFLPSVAVRTAYLLAATDKCGNATRPLLPSPPNTPTAGLRNRLFSSCVYKLKRKNLVLF